MYTNIHGEICGKTSNTIQGKHAHQTFGEWRKIPKTLLWFILYINFHIEMYTKQFGLSQIYATTKKWNENSEQNKKRSKINGKRVKKRKKTL